MGKPDQFARQRTARTIALIREMLDKNIPQSVIAQRTGYKQGSVSDIKRGRRRGNGKRYHGTPKPESINFLKEIGIVRILAGRSCARCNDLRFLFAASGLCIECEFLNLIRQGLAAVNTQ